MTKDEIKLIVDIQLGDLQKMLDEKDIKLNVNEEAKDWLAKLGYDVTFGVRPLKRTIQKYLINPLSQELLAGNFINGDSISVNLGLKGKLIFKK